MAKVSSYTELTTFSGDETFYVVEDDDGTPVSRRVTVENLRRGMTPAWTAYTPALAGSTTDPTIGNGTLEGAYSQLGSLLFFRIRIVWGSTSTYGSGTYRWGLPAGFTAVGYHVIPGWAEDTSASARALLAGRVLDAGTQVTHAYVDGSDSTVQTAIPWTWATGDTIQFSGAIEVSV
jgi:hypothetical protein